MPAERKKELHNDLFGASGGYGQDDEGSIKDEAGYEGKKEGEAGSGYEEKKEPLPYYEPGAPFPLGAYYDPGAPSPSGAYYEPGAPSPSAGGGGPSEAGPSCSSDDGSGWETRPRSRARQSPKGDYQRREGKRVGAPHR